MLFNKKENSQFNELKRELFKQLSEIEPNIKNADIRKKISGIIDKISYLKAPKNPKAMDEMKKINKFVSELKKEMLNPIDLIINNYAVKIDSLINSLAFELEG